MLLPPQLCLYALRGLLMQVCHQGIKAPNIMRQMLPSVRGLGHLSCPLGCPLLHSLHSLLPLCSQAQGMQRVGRGPLGTEVACSHQLLQRLWLTHCCSVSTEFSCAAHSGPLQWLQIHTDVEAPIACLQSGRACTSTSMTADANGVANDGSSSVYASRVQCAVHPCHKSNYHLHVTDHNCVCTPQNLIVSACHKTRINSWE